MSGQTDAGSPALSTFRGLDQAHTLDKARANGESEAVIAMKKSKLDRYAELYKNPLINAAVPGLRNIPL